MTSYAILADEEMENLDLEQIEELLLLLAGLAGTSQIICFDWLESASIHASKRKPGITALYGLSIANLSKQAIV